MSRINLGNRRAFTLVEMVVAIGIIVILAVLTVTAAGMLTEKSEIRQTENVLTILGMAVEEWETGADRKLSWGERDIPYTGVRYDLENGTPHVYTTTEMLRRIRKSSQTAAILAKIAPEFIYTYDATQPAPEWIMPGLPDDADPNAALAAGFYTSDDLNGSPLTGEIVILDAWETPIRVVHPGRLYDNLAFGDSAHPFPPDSDGTVFVNEWMPAVGTIPFYGVESIYGRAQGRRVLFVSAGPDGRFGDLSEPEGAPAHEAAHDNVYSYSVEDPHP